jgi:hypothetical protein
VSKLSHDDEIKRLKDIGLETRDLNIVNNVIYNLAAYGPKSIPAITTIIDTQADIDVRSYGLETIERIKERSVSVAQF